MDIEQYEKAYNDVFARTGDKDVSIFIVGQAAKDRRTDDINRTGGAPRGKRMDPNGPPTFNQAGLLRRLGLAIPATAGEASRLIDKARGK